MQNISIKENKKRINSILHVACTFCKHKLEELLDCRRKLSCNCPPKMLYCIKENIHYSGELKRSQLQPKMSPDNCKIIKVKSYRQILKQLLFGKKRNFKQLERKRKNPKKELLHFFYCVITDVTL